MQHVRASACTQTQTHTHTHTHSEPGLAFLTVLNPACAQNRSTALTDPMIPPQQQRACFNAIRHVHVRLLSDQSQMPGTAVMPALQSAGKPISHIFTMALGSGYLKQCCCCLY
mmetsp:Transcript_5968/g.15869  ORF Transcript_5968/g.15869 Transcript_5968/m.15869 type:complete len:113 (-) Transcript_5968:949-1287(-)